MRIHVHTMIRLGLLLLGVLLGALLVAVTLEMPLAPGWPILRRIVLVATVILFAVGFVAVNWLRGFLPRSTALGLMATAAAGFLIAAVGPHAPAWAVSVFSLVVFVGVGLAGGCLTRGLDSDHDRFRDEGPGGRRP